MEIGMKRPVLVGITGGLASGKSTVSRFWATTMDLPRIDIDEVCRQLLAKDMPGWHALRSLLPGTFFTAQGDLDRRRLRTALFVDDELRRQINGLVHPLAQDRLWTLVDRLAESMVLVDIPLLYEAGWQDRFDHHVVVYANRAACCRRLIARDRITPEEAVRSLAVQMPLAEKALLAGHVIDNSGCWLFARLQVMHLARLLAPVSSLTIVLQESP
ncbi:MAG TPA: dephospho-CoA kinase [Desulfobulbaceae bacterium]|jgi:dephospho-CoA kinase|nr:dephospho-CoA kinase [Desulfobulbaceae bacterium]